MRGRKPITEDQIQGKCETPGCLNLQQAGPKSANGYKKYVKQCSTCLRKKYNQLKTSKRDKYRKYRKSFCEECGFIGHPCQLDVHHVDCDRTNNSPENLKTLCANCHRYEHHVKGRN